MALVPAAGVGRRIGNGCPKPYRCLGQRPMICYVLETLEKCAEIDRVTVIVSAKEQEFCRKEIVPTCNLHKPWQIVVGGAQRQQSVYKGLKAIPEVAGFCND